MKKVLLPFLCLFLCTMLSGCGLMEGAFKAGFWLALVLAAIVGLLVWIFHFSYVQLSKRYPGLKGYVDELRNG